MRSLTPTCRVMDRQNNADTRHCQQVINNPTMATVNPYKKPKKPKVKVMAPRPDVHCGLAQAEFIRTTRREIKTESDYFAKRD